MRTSRHPLIVRLVARLCSEHLCTYVLTPALRDVEYEQATANGDAGGWRRWSSYARVLLAVFRALPGDLVTYRRPSSSSVLRIVVAVAFPGLTPSVSVGGLLHREPESARPGRRQHGTPED